MSGNDHPSFPNIWCLSRPSGHLTHSSQAMNFQGVEFPKIFGTLSSGIRNVDRPLLPFWDVVKRGLHQLKILPSYWEVVAPDLVGAKWPKGPAPRAPHLRGPTTIFIRSGICSTCACHLVIFSEESLFVDAINLLSVGQTAVFHLKNIWYCDETTTTLIDFLKVSESSECKPKPRRTR